MVIMLPRGGGNSTPDVLNDSSSRSDIPRTQKLLHVGA
jgi:hypothetical protein